MQEFAALNLRWATFSCYQAGSVNVNLLSSTSCFCVFIRTNAASFVSIEVQFRAWRTVRRGKTNAHGRIPVSLPSAPPLHLQTDLSTCIAPVECHKLQMSQTPGVKLVIMSGSSEDVATPSVPVLSVFLFLNISVAGCMHTFCFSAGVNTLSVHAQLCGRTHPVF